MWENVDKYSSEGWICSMDPNLQHEYPPTDSAGGNSQNSQLHDYVTHMVAQQVQERLEAMERQYQQELATREQMWSKHNEEAEARQVALQTEVIALKSQLASQSSAIPDKPKAEPAGVGTNAPAKSHKSPSKSVHNSSATLALIATPTRTLRSATRQALQQSSIAPTTPNIPSSQSTPQRVKKGKEVRKEVRKSPAQVHRMVASELPGDSGGLQKALTLHIRILWGLLNTSQVPKNPPQHIVDAFNQRISNQQDLYEHQNGPPLVNPDLVQVVRSYPTSGGSTTVRRSQKVEEYILHFIQARLASFGFVAWCPDLTQTAYSLYNSACRLIAIDTFRQALISGAYVHLGPNVSYATDMSLLIKIYDHVVHFYQHHRYKKEARNAGSVLEADGAGPLYRKRSRLANARLDFLIKNGYPNRYQQYIKARATSDDEADSQGRQNSKGQLIHWIKNRPERSDNFKLWIRKLDEVREATIRSHPTRQWKERLRLVPDQPVDTTFTSFPEDMPIDYFNPSMFNALQLELRTRVSNGTIGLPSDIQDAFTRNANEMLSDVQLMDKFGEKVLKHYNLDDVEDLGEWLDDDDEMGDISDDELEDAEQLSQRRSELAVHLSMEDIQE